MTKELIIKNNVLIAGFMDWKTEYTGFTWYLL
jgi:hypothetical protein